MINKWVKILPYWLVMKFCRSINADWGTLNTGKERKIRYYQIDEGEFVVFSEELQEVFDKRRRERKKEKVNKKLEKINKTLDKDYSLKKELKQQIKDEEEEDRERREFENSSY